MRKLLPLLACFTISDYPAWAQTIEGNYSGPVDGGTAQLKLKNANGDSVDVSILIVGTRDGCGGSLEGKGTRKDQTITLTAKDSFSGDECRLTLVIQDAGIESSENNCMSSHGHTCSFDSYNGLLVRKANPKPAKPATAKKP